MVGGWLIEIEHGAVTKLWVANPREGEMCVHAEDDAGHGWPALGQSLWWQSGRIYFDSDRRSLRKIGYSHQPESCREVHRTSGNST